MSPALSVAASLSVNIRQDIGIQALSRSQPISHIAATHQVSRKFVYQQSDKAQQALEESLGAEYIYSLSGSVIPRLQSDRR